ncbi:circadian clock KaiB family protein [Desertivirga brevis]|uniref:circadian clock KaiB family protein n=1 Tax=Desertivirga brevis TaxID=2810310 RepID=UPI001A97A8F5|nr:circadian clock KaiB family protein [Pedobacter sp. SYSU D00873]
MNSSSENASSSPVLELRLYIAGSSLISMRAITNLQEILESYLKGQYELEIVDIHQQPELAQQDNISALPVLVKTSPVPKRLLVGDMSDKGKVLRGLGIVVS